MARSKQSPRRRVTSTCNLFTVRVFCEVSKLDSSLYRIDWIRQLVTLLDDLQITVHTAAWKAFDSFVKSVPKDELEPLVVLLRQTIESTGASGRTVPGFDKGVSPMVPWPLSMLALQPAAMSRGSRLPMPSVIS